MSSERSVWLGSHLRGAPHGADAHAAAAALGSAVHAELLAAGDRLAIHSTALAQRFYRRAPAVWIAFGADGFARWSALGEELATGVPPCREGAMTFFAVAPRAFGGGGLDTAGAWCALGREVARASPKLGAIFFRTTAGLLRRPGGFHRLRRWVDVGLALHAQRGWQGEFLAQAYFSAAPRAITILDPSAYQLWAGAGAALYPAIKERDFFGQLRRAIGTWSAEEQILLLRTVIALAAPSGNEAHALYRTLPDALAPLSSALRGALLRVLQRTGQPLIGAIADVAPVAGVLVQRVPADSALDALAQLERLVAACPAAVVAALRVLPRLYEEASPMRVREWFGAGLELAQVNPAAGMAFFALESRTSLKVLRAAPTAATLDEAQGLLRKFVQMLSGAPASIRTLEDVCLRPPLEEFPGEQEIALPMRIDWCSAYEDNQRLYRFLAAQLAGRREFGTYPAELHGLPADPDAPPGGALYRYVTAPERPDGFEDLFLLAEGMRIHRRICAEYDGLAADGAWVAARALERARTTAVPSRSQRLDAAFAALLETPPSGPRPRWLDAQAVALIERAVAPLAALSATVVDSVRVAEALVEALAREDAGSGASHRGVDAFRLEVLAAEALVDLYPDVHGEPSARVAAPVTPSETPVGEPGSADRDAALQLAGADRAQGGAVPLSADELRRLLERGADLQIAQADGDDAEGLGLFITDLSGKVPREQIEELRRLLGHADGTPRRARRFADESGGESFFAYDEWDYHIDDYRSRWCKLYELGIEGDGGEFFSRALGDYAKLIPDVRRQFQRVRPELYRVIRGLEDGEDFDLNAAVAARIDRRAGLAPSNRLYVARKREERDVATLFLVDMSASTDEPVAPGAGGRSRRIIDVIKETLVIMGEALEDIGDAYAIYGFSGHGRERVEVYRVKSFAEALTPAVKGRIGGIAPKRSTRMGPALRHAVEKLNAVTARIKHLFLLSDGFPQDFDYGQDRRSNTYGIRDTAVALREAEAAGVTPFCITVDEAGHDYLRQMCDVSRYMVIEDITALPRELPKIYQRVVRA
ncbi:MAG: nitric oxide reductase activation protein NorD [Candidatus Binatia bacterium]